jgi:hypothetical protein
LVKSIRHLRGEIGEELKTRATIVRAARYGAVWHDTDLPGRLQYDQRAQERRLRPRLSFRNSWSLYCCWVGEAEGSVVKSRFEKDSAGGHERVRKHADGQFRGSNWHAGTGRRIRSLTVSCIPTWDEVEASCAVDRVRAPHVLVKPLSRTHD